MKSKHKKLRLRYTVQPYLDIYTVFLHNDMEISNLLTLQVVEPSC